mmetsp:Transcript_21091/g.61554  ORF Transcript_21091/g.61554 Transcript_21091/m.61554 type:complete len:579 (-) Transcript_21091:1175-2911(-)
MAPAGHGLGAEVLGGAAHGETLVHALLLGGEVGNVLAETKVDYLQVAHAVEHDVLGLEVPIGDAEGMNVLEACDHTCCVEPAVVLAEASEHRVPGKGVPELGVPLAVDVRPEISGGNELNEHEELVVRLERGDEAEDERVAGAAQHVGLAENVLCLSFRNDAGFVHALESQDESGLVVHDELDPAVISFSQDAHDLQVFELEALWQLPLHAFADAQSPGNAVVRGSRLARRGRLLQLLFQVLVEGCVGFSVEHEANRGLRGTTPWAQVPHCRDRVLGRLAVEPLNAKVGLWRNACAVPTDECVRLANRIAIKENEQALRDLASDEDSVALVECLIGEHGSDNVQLTVGEGREERHCSQHFSSLVLLEVLLQELANRSLSQQLLEACLVEADYLSSPDVHSMGWGMGHVIHVEGGPSHQADISEEVSWQQHVFQVLVLRCGVAFYRTGGSGGVGFGFCEPHRRTAGCVGRRWANLLDTPLVDNEETVGNVPCPRDYLPGSKSLPEPVALFCLPQINALQDCLQVIPPQIRKERDLLEKSQPTLLLQGFIRGATQQRAEVVLLENKAGHRGRTLGNPHSS